MDNPVVPPVLSFSPQSVVEQPIFSSPAETSSPRWLLWLIGGILLIGFGIAIGLFSAKFLSQSSSLSQISSYADCLVSKGSIIQESYPATCVTASGQRFTQPISSNSVSCGGWNTGGSVVCKCTGKLIKPACPPTTVCDAIGYRCEGQCEQCCWKGIAENNQYPKCQD